MTVDPQGLALRVIAQRIVVTLTGPTQQVRGELTLVQARTLRAEIDDLIRVLEAGEERPGTLSGLIEQIGVRA